MSELDEMLIQARARLVVVRAEHAQVMQTLGRVNAEINELVAFEKVALRYAPKPEVAAKTAPADPPTRAVSLREKPSGIPTFPKMILEVLDVAAALGEPMTPKEITKFIAEKWWPSVTVQDVSPKVWRMQKKGQVVRDEKGGYSLPNNEAPADDTAGASKAWGSVPTPVR
jgi:hypothetical protein